jgi:hypothetical protein
MNSQRPGGGPGATKGGSMGLSEGEFVAGGDEQTLLSFLLDNTSGCFS